jgi:hypothetical protein
MSNILDDTQQALADCALRSSNSKMYTCVMCYGHTTSILEKRQLQRQLEMLECQRIRNEIPSMMLSKPEKKSP